jgi:hypothetical protein
MSFIWSSVLKQILRRSCLYCSFCIIKKILTLNFKISWSIYIIIHVFCVCVCVCVWHSIGSTPGHHTNLRLVSLKLSGPEPAIFKKKRILKSDQWPNFRNFLYIHEMRININSMKEKLFYQKDTIFPQKFLI